MDDPHASVLVVGARRVVVAMWRSLAVAFALVRLMGKV